MSVSNAYLKFSVHLLNKADSCGTSNRFVSFEGIVLLGFPLTHELISEGWGGEEGASAILSSAACWGKNLSLWQHQ